MNLLGLEAAVAAHEDVDVLVIALGAREQLEPHRRDLVEDSARGDRVVLREVGSEFMARNHARDCGTAVNDWYSDHVTGFARCLEIVVAAGGWKPYVRAPRVSLVILRRLCEKERARPPPELACLFALDKFIFWRVLSFWRSEREMPVYLMNTDVPAPPEHQFRYG